YLNFPVLIPQKPNQGIVDFPFESNTGLFHDYLHMLIQILFFWHVNCLKFGPQKMLRSNKAHGPFGKSE
ncbi:MAG: hypothetical protein ACLFRG_18885, partial [Desulfococcaceae bacterium]